MSQIHWINAVDGSFNDGAAWSGGKVPQSGDNAIINAAGPAFTVVAQYGSQYNDTVGGIQTSANATLEITALIRNTRTYGTTFDALSGTNGGVNAGTISVGSRDTFECGVTLDNSGVISLNSGVYGSTMRLSSNTTLSGGGQVILNDSAGNLISRNSQAYILTNVDNTISGAGNIDPVQVNQAKGVIDATGTNNPLILAQAGVTTNAGLIEATGNAGLIVSYATVDDSGGGVILAANGSKVSLLQATIIGGTLETSGTGVIEDTGSTTRLDGANFTVNNKGVIDILDSRTLQVQGAIANTGTIGLAGAGAATTLLVMGGGATLSGGGTVTLSDSGANVISGSGLTNIDNTISGAGQVVSLINGAKGVIDATGTNNPLILGLAGVTTNAGLIEATGKAGLIVSYATVDDSGGGVILAANGSNISLLQATIIGGTLKTSGTGVINDTGTTSLLDGANFTVRNTGVIDILDSKTLNVQGAIANSGTVNLNGAADATTLQVAGGTGAATLSGGGTVTMSDSAANVIRGGGASYTLTNVNNTISGAGFIGGLHLVNRAAGVIDATGTNNALILNTNLETITNAGLIETTGTGGCVVGSAIVNSGTLLADGGTLTLNAAVTGRGAVDIAKGILDIANVGAAENVAFTGKTGKLELAQSQSYSGKVTGFSLRGRTTLDLRDIAFDGATTVSYSGTKSGGTLTVTHGSEVASIRLVGDYRSSVFTLSRDGHGGTNVVDPPAAGAAAAPVHRLVEAMAAIGVGGAVATYAAAEPWRARVGMLTAPRMQLA